MSEYRIIQAKDVKTLQSQVQKALEEGWELQGGVSADQMGVYQAMTLSPLKSSLEVLL